MFDPGRHIRPSLIFVDRSGVAWLPTLQANIRLGWIYWQELTLIAYYSEVVLTTLCFLRNLRLGPIS